MRIRCFVFATVTCLGCSSEGSSPADASGGSAGSGASGGSAASGGTSTGGAPSGGAAGAGGAPSGGGSAGSPSCLAEAQGIEVADLDLDAFPSYSVDGCTLVYVSASKSELRERDLATGADELVAPASESPSRPSLAGAVLAWEALEAGKSVVRVRVSGAVSTLSGGFDHAGEPRATTDAVVFTGWLGPLSTSDSDVFLYEPGTKQVSLAAGGKGQQRFADVSPTHVAVSDFSEDPGGVYMGDGTTLANVLVIDRATQVVSTIVAQGKQAFPSLGSTGTVTYLEWLGVHPVPKLQDYTLLALPLDALGGAPKQIAAVQSEQAVRPTARDGFAEWVVRWGGASVLWRGALDGSSPPVELSLGTATVVHAPSATDAMTVLAVRASASDAPKTLAIPH